MLKSASPSTVLTAFKVKFLQYGYLDERTGRNCPARWRTVELHASSSDAAIRLAQRRYRRAEKFSVV